MSWKGKGLGNMTRTMAREQAFLLIFERQFKQDELDDIVQDAVEARDFEPDEYIEILCKGVWDRQQKLDEQIEKHLSGWKLSRISKTALAVLRLACFEILFLEETPDSVAANEAVNLAKRYCGEEDAAFINGVLGSIIGGKASSDE